MNLKIFPVNVGKAGIFLRPWQSGSKWISSGNTPLTIFHVFLIVINLN